MTFEQLMRDRQWKPLRNCPGRYVLDGAHKNLRPQDLLGDELEIMEYLPDAARDAVLVFALDDGGLISYRRDDGSFLHTLNTPEGFQRKLLQLGIDLSGPPDTRS
ncbi:MAG TPA: hypothetical protein VGO91_09145 [Pyrinomonadaceae bacterium]|jgi:hypothetical protein|nr:hypothetical protein [Pyrinomonadaceae bacterium]